MKFIIPRGIKAISDKVSKLSIRTWAQVIIDESEFPAIKKLQDDLGLSKKKVCIVHHRIRSNIPKHSDDMSTTCYIVPVSITGEWCFYCHGMTDRKVKIGDAIRFNDFNDHGLRMTKQGTIKLFTVSVDKY